MLCLAMVQDDDGEEATLGTELGDAMAGASEADETLADEETVFPRDGHLDRGDEVGRYVVLDRIGRGAMGVVYAAYDPELDRKVALKLLRPAMAGGRAARERLLREARAMARVSHANVATVHDVGMVSDRVFIAMEFIAGTTLAVRTGDPDWPTTLELYVSAGRGLAAAHAHDLVHRDFKPDNVLVGTTAACASSTSASHGAGTTRAPMNVPSPRANWKHASSMVASRRPTGRRGWTNPP